MSLTIHVPTISLQLFRTHTLLLHKSVPCRPLTRRRDGIIGTSAFSTVSKRIVDLTKLDSMPPKDSKEGIAVARPSSSVVLISPGNEVLLLHRVRTSTSFPSAHVFPGGNISLSQDGEVPQPKDVGRHEDSIPYRRAAIRELFEESGILLAKDRDSGEFIHVDEANRERGRHAIHDGKITFQEWLQQLSSTAEPDTGTLIPFTHWITPPNLRRRYTTQMYLYLLPVIKEHSAKAPGLPADGQKEELHVPKDDGGIEILEATFRPASDWLQKARSGEIILYPPQFLLLHIVSQFLDKEPRPSALPEKQQSGVSELQQNAELQRRRTELVEFVHSGSPSFGQRYISPKSWKFLEDKRAVLSLDHPGRELSGTGKKGDSERVILVRFTEEGPRNVEVRWKTEFLTESSERL